MPIALFFVTHEGIASNLLNISEKILASDSLNAALIEVPMDEAVESVNKKIETLLTQLDTADGIVFVTDIYGATPSNIAQSIANKYDAAIISGLNLPMMIRLLSYRDCPQDELLRKALEGARQGIELHTANS